MLLFSIVNVIWDVLNDPTHFYRFIQMLSQVSIGPKPPGRNG